MTHRPTENDCELMDALARRHGGVFSVVEADQVGLDDWGRRGLVRSGLLLRLRRGWHATEAALTAGSAPDPLELEVPEPIRRAEALHRLMVRSYQVEYARRAVVTGHSALLMMGLPAHGARLGQVSLARTRPGRTRAAKTLLLGPHDPGATVSEAGVVDAATAVVEHGLRAGMRSALASSDQALRAGSTDVAALREAIARARNRTGVPALHALPSLVDPVAESVGESLLRFDLMMAGFAVESQVRLTTRSGARRVDFVIKGTRVIVEFDGLKKFAGPRSSSAVPATFARDAELIELGYQVVHVFWNELGDIKLLQRRVMSAHRASARAVGA